MRIKDLDTFELNELQNFTRTELEDHSFDDQLEDSPLYDEDLGYLAGGMLLAEDSFNPWKVEEDYEGYTNHEGMVYLGDGVYA